MFHCPLGWTAILSTLTARPKMRVISAPGTEGQLSILRNRTETPAHQHTMILKQRTHDDAYLFTSLTMRELR